MVTLPIVNQNGQNIGQIELPSEVFGMEVKSHLLYDAVRAYLANRRNANPRTKTRAMVSGGGKKPYRQKGTGRARQGSIRSPHFRGGGVVFGPNGRLYTIRLNRKVRRGALRSALSLRVAQAEAMVVDQIALAMPKTRLFASVAQNLNASSALFVTASRDETLERTSRNIPGIKVVSTDGMSVYDILRFPKLVLTRSAAERLGEKLKV